MDRDLLLPGVEIDAPKTEAGMERFVKVEVKVVRIVDAVSRSAGAGAYTPLPDGVKDDDLVELDFENGDRSWKQWMTLDQLREISQPGMSRGTEGEKALLVPHTWEAKDTSRGLGTIALKSLKIFGIDTPEKFAKKGAK